MLNLVLIVRVFLAEDVPLFPTPAILRHHSTEVVTKVERDSSNDREVANLSLAYPQRGANLERDNYQLIPYLEAV